MRERAVCGYLDASGTVTITATGLSVPEASAACERLERLADAVKRAGHPGALAQIRADVFCGLLDGRYHHRTQDEIIADLLAGALRRRPAVAVAGECRGGVVEIHLPADLLERLTTHPLLAGRWAGVVAEIAAQYARRDELAAALERHPSARFARGALARHVQIRDRTCSHPGCRRPAAESDLDHTRDHGHGGPTTSVNIGPGCGRHHFYKTELGWRLEQPAPGHFEWISPLGRTYRTRGEPIMPPLPEPRIAQRPPEPGSHPVEGEQQPILRLPPRDTRPQPPPPPTDPDSDQPPF